MHQTAIDFLTSDGVSLEGILTKPDNGSDWYPVVVVCHPHPSLGGNMEHPMVTSICRAAHHEGIGSLRFNFRGVGRSEGEFTNGETEQDDVRAALEITKLLPGTDVTRIALAGYSFGASAMLRGLRRYKTARSLVFIAPPIASVRQSRVMRDKRPKLFMVGRDDRVVPSVELQRLLDDVRRPVQFHEVRDGNHALDGQREEVAERATEFLLQSLKIEPTY